MKPLLPSDNSWPSRSHWGALLFVAAAILAVGVWLALHRYDRAYPEQPTSARTRTNLPPVATTIFIESVADEVLVVDIREHGLYLAHVPRMVTGRTRRSDEGDDLGSAVPKTAG